MDQQRALSGWIATHQYGGRRSRMAKAWARRRRSGPAGHYRCGIARRHGLRSCFGGRVIDLASLRRRNARHDLGRNHLAFLNHAGWYFNNLQ